MKVLRIKEVCSRVALSRTLVYEMMAQRRFPSAIRIGKRASGWLESEINEWIDEQAAKRKAQPQVSTAGGRSRIGGAS